MQQCMQIEKNDYTLGECVSSVVGQLVQQAGMTCFPSCWQMPAATEKAACNAMFSVSPQKFKYFGFAWATLIDAMRSSKPVQAVPILKALSEAVTEPQSQGKRRVTVTQHIYSMHFKDLFKACGITDIFWSHATNDTIEMDGMRIHPFPLYPAQTPLPCSKNELDRPRKYLANFVGAFNPKIYISNVRQVIFDSAGEDDDILIVKRNAWHFNRAVYEEQIKNFPAKQKQIAIEERRKHEYLKAIRDSWFTLCPTGSGPNSIRLFESLALGSIPILLTRDLRLPGDFRLWELAVLIEEDSEDGYRRALKRAKTTTEEERRMMICKGRELFDEVGPNGYAMLIMDTMQ